MTEYLPAKGDYFVKNENRLIRIKQKQSILVTSDDMFCRGKIKKLSNLSSNVGEYIQKVIDKESWHYKPKAQPHMSSEMKKILISFDKEYLIPDNNVSCPKDNQNSVLPESTLQTDRSIRVTMKPVWNNIIQKKVIRQQTVIKKIKESLAERKWKEEALERERMKKKVLEKFSLTKVSKETEKLILRRSCLEQTLRKTSKRQCIDPTHTELLDLNNKRKVGANFSQNATRHEITRKAQSASILSKQIPNIDLQVKQRKNHLRGY